MTIRVHELAKELKISTMALKKHLTDLGVNVKSHMSLVEDEVADKIRLKYKEQIDAEKRAERDRKRLIEMRQAAKAQKSAQEAETIKAEEPVPPVAEPVKEVPKKEEPKPVKEPEKETPIPVKEKPVEVKPEEKPHKPAPEKPKAVPKPKPEVIPPKTAAPAKPEPWKKQEPSAPSIKPIPTPPSVEIKKEEKKFGKAKISHEELGEKSKHKKAIISSTKKAKQKLIETIEIDEAEISRNIKKTLQKSSKRKKYHREAQYVEDRSNEIVIREFTSVSELAKIMNVSPSDIISKFFMMGQLVTMNQRLDRDSLEMICDEFKVDYRFEDEYGMDIIDKEREQYNNVKEEPRPPVVTIMGHVDHGKTSILDYIRNTNVVAGESGNITQHIGAYQIEINKHKITFLDTPGHEAFTAMRARGANVTDIAVIVISATEGVKAQTREAIDHAKAAGVSIILAINKVDLPEANVDKVIAQLMEIGVYPEQYGGDIPWCRTSVVTGEGILNLIELILLTAEILELKAKRDVPASGVVIEAGMDARMGPFATILMQEGTLHKGDIVVCGAVHGRIRKMENERGAELKVLYPSDVARVYGLSDTPKAGDILNQVDSEKTARNISTERQQIRLEREKYQNKSSLQNIFARIKEEQINTLNIILKTDTDGSAEALADSFQKLSNEEVSVNIIHKSVGGISEADVSLAAASDAIIIGFHVRPSHQARKLAEEEGVQIKLYQVIYDVIDDLQNALEGMLKPKYEEKVIGSAIVKQVFKIKRVGTIAGCQVDKGVIQANCKVRLYRNDVLVTEDTISSLKHYADDVKEVRAGSECGLTLANFSDIKEDDVLEAYIVNEVNKKL
ncbi:MAG: translation initiation factor IF-2 [Candidatus Cloacimonadota bacterium]|nr:translation initiation factor IF-2 [Candidatus Cloacimonas sp.]MDI9572527.1 translation initiation factor IF-2 [Candidatus Cloacimonadota bacterium]HNV61601.1 translation initiation factor IF-2 [Candidatus Cloacimonas acidaminovorans]HNZ88482.1 translation initiation factor IF-2 [Candidatus Cloacimonas acidaminovorans]HOI01210.1 translation initiation factor IF-2 [Candidatus Cloacimonas acidaminovorans]